MCRCIDSALCAFGLKNCAKTCAWSVPASFRMGCVRASLVHEAAPGLVQITRYVNTSDEEWRIRKEKRMVTMMTYHNKWPLGCALVSLLQIHGDQIDLRRIATAKKQSNGSVLLWPSAENRNVSKRMWEMQAGAARHCLEGNAMLYFKFWALCAQPRSRAYLRFWT